MLLPLISSLFSSNSTWNTFIFLILNFLFMYHHKILKNIKKIQWFKSSKTQFTLKGKINYKNHMITSIIYPKNFLAVNKRIIDHFINSTEVYNYEINEYPYIYSTDESVIFFTINKPFLITPDIMISTSIDKVSSLNDNKDYECITLEINIQTPYKNFKKIKEFIDESIKKYNIDRLNNLKDQHIFVFNEIDDKIPIYTEYPFTTTKRFNNMFFDQKEDILNRINNFLNNKKEYERLGIPYTLGILLHGIAGTGKTSIIKSLAEYTKRHIVIIPVNKIKNIDTLKSIFLNVDVNGIDVPNYKRLYVFEDADCSAWRNILLNRECIPEYNKTNKDDILMKIISENLNKKTNETETKQKITEMTLTLSEILELLDGIVEIDGRMIIMTTNYVDVFDSALIRPGRFDLKIEMTKMSKNNIREMFELWFPGEYIPEHIYTKIKDFEFTQASIGSIFSSRNFDDIFDKLTHTI